MDMEQVSALAQWWEEQTIPGKDQFKLDEQGNITLLAKPHISERTVGTITDENKEVTVKALTDKFDSALVRVKELEHDWAATEDKVKLAEKVEHLREFLQSVNAIGDFDKEVRKVNDWSNTVKEILDVNIKAKNALVEQAEGLVESTEWKETTQAFKDISDKWKHSGHVDRVSSDRLWSRIEAARNSFLERKRKQHDDEEKDQFLNLDLKIELAELAEGLAQSAEWKAATEAFVQIVEKWKGIGRTLPKKNEELWQRIMTARSTFFDRKKAHYDMVQEEQAVNYTLKLSIVERAEALRDSTDWNKTAMAFAALMEEWKKTGRIAAEKSEELWKRYNDAQENFFSARKRHNETTRAVFDNNFQQKSALLKRAEEIKNSSRWGEVTVEMNKLFDDWKKIGPVPKEHNNTLWDAFLAARKHFFGRKDANRDQRKMFAEAQKSARMEHAFTLVHKMRQEIEVEEEKLADFQNALENITPGKKAEELRTHLEVLIGDSNAKMKRLKEKLAAGEDELTHIREEEAARKQRDDDKSVAQDKEVAAEPKAEDA